MAFPIVAILVPIALALIDKYGKGKKRKKPRKR